MWIGRVFITLLQHFAAPLCARNTLPGLALASAAVDWNSDQRDELPKRLPGLFGLGADQGWRVLQSLLGIFLRRKALILPEGILLGHLMGTGPKVVTFHHNFQDSMDGRQRIRWNPYEAKQKKRVITASPQAEIVARFLGKDKFQDEAVIARLLDDVWAAFRRVPTSLWPLARPRGRPLVRLPALRCVDGSRYPRPLCLAKLRGHAENAEPGGYRASLAESPLVSPLHARSRAAFGGAGTHRAVDQRRRTGVPAQVHQRRNQCPFQLDHVRDGGRCRPTEVCVPAEGSANASQRQPTTSGARAAQAAGERAQPTL
jgi:hypothetical protein